jgi:hypothetical protein
MTEKALAKHLGTTHRAGGVIVPGGPTDEDLFERQREDLE